MIGKSIFLAFIVLATNFAAAAVLVSVSPGDCERINEAIKNLPRSGGSVLLQEGLYLCHSPVVIDRDNVHLIGKGRGQTLLKAAPAKAMPILVIGSPHNTDFYNGVPYPSHETKNVLVRGLSIDGDYHSHPDPGQHECFDPRTRESQFCGNDPGHFIRNNGITVRRTQNIRIYDVQTDRAYSGGIVLEKWNKDLIIDGFQATDNWFDGFAGYETSNAVIRNFKLNGNRFSGISVDIAFEGNLFVDGEASGNGDNGVFSATVGNNIYRRVKVIENKNLGYYFDGKRNYSTGELIPQSCDGNRIENGHIVGPRAGVMVNHICQGLVISSTLIQQADRDCLSLHPGASVDSTTMVCQSKSGTPTWTNKPGVHQ